MRWQRRTSWCGACLTPLPSQRDPWEVRCRAYQWRGQGEWLVKAEPASAQGPALATAQPMHGKGLLGTAMAVAALTRFVAHLPPLRAAGPLATRQGAMGALEV